MSTATISYSSIKNAASEAKSVSRKLDTYADHLTSQVYNKLNSYSGSYTGNISTAISKTNEKVVELRKKSTAYERYSDDLYDLKDTCVNTDKAVKSMVSSLTANFKSNHGIRNSKILNAINYHLTAFSNNNCARRWIKSGLDKAAGVKEYITQSLEDWWDYDGGEQLVKGVLVGLAEFAIAVIVVATLTVTGTIWGVIAATATIIGAAIMGANAIINIVNECRGYYETKYNGDPALGRRRSNENTLQDTLRRESDSKADHITAAILDGVEFVCQIITFVDGAIDFAKNGLKWIKENKISMDSIKNIGTNIKESIGDIGAAVRGKDWARFKDLGTRVKSDFIYNMRKRFMNFDTVKDGAKTVKNYLGITKDFLKDGFNIKTIKNVLKDKILLPNLTIFTVNKENPKLIKFMGKQIQMDFFDHVTVKDVTDFYTDLKKLFEFKIMPESIVDVGILDKFSKNTSVDIKIPDICIPKINISIPEIEIRDVAISKVVLT